MNTTVHQMCLFDKNVYEECIHKRAQKIIESNTVAKLLEISTNAYCTRDCNRDTIIPLDKLPARNSI